MNKVRDLGTYHLKVEFKDGTGYIQKWNTGMRFSHGSDSVHPLNADLITPPWESEEELFNSMVFMYIEGNYACDCNRKFFLDSAMQRDHVNHPCDRTLKLLRLTAIRPDGSTVILKI